MSHIYLSGFDYYNTEAVAISSGDPFNALGSYQYETGRFSGRGRHWEPSSSTNSYLIVPHSGSSEIYTGFHWGVDESTPGVGAYTSTFFNGGVGVVQVAETGASITTGAHVKLTHTHAHGFRVQSGTTVLGWTANDIYQQYAMNWIELYALVDPAVGAVELRVNGQTVLLLAGVNTQSGGTNAIDDVIFTTRSSNSTADDQHDYDNIYINDEAGAAPFNGFLGEHEIVTVFPDGDGFQNDFTPTGAGTTNADRVDENPPDDDTTYVESSTVGHIDSYTMANLPYVADNIPALQVDMRNRSSSATTRTVRQRVRSGGADFLGANVVNTAAFAGYREFVLQDPNGPAAWTNGGVNGMEVGHELMV